MEDILDAALRQWSAQVTATLNNTPNGAGSPNHTAHPNGTVPQNGGVPQNGAAPQHAAGTSTPSGAPASSNGNGAVPPQGFGLVPPGSMI